MTVYEKALQATGEKVYSLYKRAERGLDKKEAMFQEMIGVIEGAKIVLEAYESKRTLFYLNGLKSTIHTWYSGTPDQVAHAKEQLGKLNA